MNSQRGFVPILILLFVVVVGSLVGGAYFYGRSSSNLDKTTPTVSPGAQTSPLPTPDKTANWLSYTDTTMPVSFAYPSEWTLEPALGKGASINIHSWAKGSEPRGRLIPQTEMEIEIAILDNPQRLSLKDYLNQSQKDYFNQALPDFKDKVAKEESIVVNGLQSIKQTLADESSSIVVYIPKENRVFSILAVPGNSQYIQLFNKLLTTLRL